VKKTLTFLLALLLAYLPIRGLGDERPNALDELDMSAMVSGFVEVPGRGQMRYYAQNDPVWASMIYRFPDQSNQPRFSGAGCVPSALANAFANLVAPERLTAILDYSYRNEGFSICSCSMNRKGCYQKHSRFRMETAADVENFLCLVIGSYMSGNNPEGTFINGNLSKIWELSRIFGLTCTQVRQDFAAAAKAVSQGDMAVMLVGGDDCPFTQKGHALALCGVGEDSYYFLDSFRREEYELDRLHIVEVLEPGLVAVKKDKLFRLGAYEIYILSRREPENAAM